jgi:pimeloyl-ACP methyl ester carboxylesterase
MSEMRRFILLFVALVGLVVVVLTSCGGGSQQTNTPANATPNVIEGRFDVGDYKLYMRCVGSGSPTVVYFHGWIQEPASGGASNAGEIPSMLRDEHRICVYDRANVGRSDDVSGLRTGESSVTDLHRLLDAAGVEPPYVLLGASFGGLISYTYAATYPEEVVGMVLLDAQIPGLLKYEHYWPKDERLQNVDWSDTEEKIDQYDVNMYAQQVAGKEPDIPLTYLLATPISEEAWGGPPAWREAALDELPKYVESFSPGVLKKVESPHYMEEAIPDRIAKEVEMLIASISQQGAAHDGKASQK